MGRLYKVELLLTFVVELFLIIGSAKIPEVQLEALREGGFRAHIAAAPGITWFQVDVKVNKKNISKVAEKPENGYFVVNFGERLQVGDLVEYRCDILSDGLHYSKELYWEVKDLLNSYTPLHICNKSATTIIEQTKCAGDLILEDEFGGASVNRSIWTVEHRIPTYHAENYEFNSYEDRSDTVFLKDGVVYLKPVPLQNINDVRGVLNLTNGCTAANELQCVYTQVGPFLLPPVKSGRITSKASFKYGKVEIKAQLPAGDWIVPVLQLQKFEKNGDVTPKILIAYSRGNLYFRKDGDAEEGGSKVLVGGPILEFNYPARDAYLKSKSSDASYNGDYHVYTLEWLPDKMLFYVDSTLYGDIPSSQLSDSSTLDNEFVLSLGVYVGGINDFPDDYVTNSDPKPWSNNERNFLKKFFDARDTWLQTWNGDNTALKVDYVRVWAV